MPGRILGALENVSELENLCTLSATEGQLLARWYASPRRWCPPRGHRMVPRPPIVLNHVDARVIAPHRRGEFSAPSKRASDYLTPRAARGGSGIAQDVGGARIRRLQRQSKISKLASMANLATRHATPQLDPNPQYSNRFGAGARDAPRPGCVATCLPAECAPRATVLRQLGLSDSAIRRHLGVSDKKARKALKWHWG